MSKTYIYLSRWNEFAGEPGIALLEFNEENGELKFLKNAEETLTTGCTAVDKEKSILYVVNEIKDNPEWVKGGGGRLFAFRINNETGDLTEISRADTLCPCPCYISIDPTGEYMVCAHHSGYNVATRTVQKEDGSWAAENVFDDATIVLFKLEKDGTIGKITDVVRHNGRKDNFLLHSHPHSAVWAPDGRFFAVADKGDDNIYMYRIDYDSKKIVPMGEPNKDMPMSTPRYCLFHPTERLFYVNHEMKTFISSFSYDENGKLTLLGKMDCLPEGMEMPKVSGKMPGQKPAMQVMVMSQDGKYIYNAVNGKGIDGVSVFEVQQDGTLKLIQYEKAGGVWARGVGISPDGRFLVVSCIDGDGAVMSYRIADDGKIDPTGSKVFVPGAAFVTFYEPER